MNEYSIEWRGTITRDIGWKVIKADSLDEAKTKFRKDHGAFREIVAVSLITSDRAFACGWRQ